MPDVTMTNHGTIVAFTFNSDSAREFAEEQIQAESWQYFGSVLLARENADKAVPWVYGKTNNDRWHRINEAFAEQVESTPGIEHYGETVRALVDACAMYGDGWLIEPLQKRNCVVGLSGELILLDPIFDANLLEAERKATQQAAIKRQGW